MSRDCHVDALVGRIPALRPRMRAATGFIVVLLRLADDVDRHWAGTAADDAEELHDLRIAVRRTRCMLRESRKVLPRRVVDTARTEFRRLADLTGPPRDLDVLVAQWPRYAIGLGARELTAVERLRTVIDEQRAAAHEALTIGLGVAARVDLDLWRHHLGGLLADGPGGADHARRRLSTVVARRVLRSHERLIERGRLVQHDSPDALLHDLRKEAKNLRYLVECFEDLFVDEPRRALLTRLKDLQDVLGEHQDAVAHRAVIAAAVAQVRRPSATTRRAADAVVHELERRRDGCRAEFAEVFAEFDSKATRAALRQAAHRLDR